MDWTVDHSPQSNGAQCLTFDRLLLRIPVILHALSFTFFTAFLVTVSVYRAAGHVRTVYENLHFVVSFLYFSFTVVNPVICKSSGSHDSEYEEYRLLVYSTVYSRSRPTFLRCVLSPSSGWWWRQYTPLKRLSREGSHLQSVICFIACWKIYPWNIPKLNDEMKINPSV
jgi:hypothetical protein